jgi:hypothetical protein
MPSKVVVTKSAGMTTGQEIVNCFEFGSFEPGNIYLESHGTVHVIINRQVADVPAGAFVAVAPYYEIPTATRHVRLECLGEKVNTWSHAIEIRLACDIPLRAVNDGRLPGYAEISSGGTLLRLDQATAKTLWRYLNLPGDPLAPQCSQHQLGSNFFALHAARNDVQEPARMILGPGWSVSSAERELKRWLKSGEARGGLRRKPRSESQEEGSKS